jgi:hypothetical protein
MNLYELKVHHLSLNALEHLNRQDPSSHPFTQVATVTSQAEFMHPVLEDIGGEPYIVTIVGSDGIVFKNLNTGYKFTLGCRKWAPYEDLVSTSYFSVMTPETEPCIGAIYQSFPCRPEAAPYSCRTEGRECSRCGASHSSSRGLPYPFREQ